MAKPEVRQLSVPPDALDSGGQEVLRAFVVNKAVSVSLQRAFDDPAVWGLLLADLARHAARIYAQESKYSESEALAEIRDMFEAEFERPTDVGTTSRVN